MKVASDMRLLAQGRERIFRHRSLEALTVARSRYPAWFLLPGLLLGQLVTVYDSAVGSLVLVTSAGIGGLLLFKPRAPFRYILTPLVCSLFVGSTSVLVTVRSPLTVASEETLLLSVVEEPRYRRKGEVQFVAEIVSSESQPHGGRLYCRAVNLPWNNLFEPESGTLFYARVKTYALRRVTDPFSYDSYLARRGIQARCRVNFATKPILVQAGPVSRARSWVRQRIESVLGSGERAGLLLSMGLGIRDVLTDRTERAFKATGLAHLLVVSGYQVTLVFYLLRRTFLFLGVPICQRVPFNLRRFGGIPAFTGSVAFVLLTGAEPAGVRALVALGAFVLGEITGRVRDFIQSLGVSLLLVSVIWPGAALEPGVQLTYAALLGIGIGLTPNGYSTLRGYLRVCWYASLFTSIVTIAWFGYFSPIGLLLNPLLAPLAAFVSCKVGLAGLALHALDPELGAPVLQIAANLLESFRDGVLWASGLSWVVWKPEGVFKWALVAVLLGITGRALKESILGLRRLRGV